MRPDLALGTALRRFEAEFDPQTYCNQLIIKYRSLLNRFPRQDVLQGLRAATKAQLATIRHSARSKSSQRSLRQIEGHRHWGITWQDLDIEFAPEIWDRQTFLTHLSAIAKDTRASWPETLHQIRHQAEQARRRCLAIQPRDVQAAYQQLLTYSQQPVPTLELQEDGLMYPRKRTHSPNLAVPRKRSRHDRQHPSPAASLTHDDTASEGSYSDAGASTSRPNRITAGHIEDEYARSTSSDAEVERARGAKGDIGIEELHNTSSAAEIDQALSTFRDTEMEQASINIGDIQAQHARRADEQAEFLTELPLEPLFSALETGDSPDANITAPPDSSPPSSPASQPVPTALECLSRIYFPNALPQFIEKSQLRHFAESLSQISTPQHTVDVDAIHCWEATHAALRGYDYDQAEDDPSLQSPFRDLVLLVAEADESDGDSDNDHQLQELIANMESQIKQAAVVIAQLEAELEELTACIATVAYFAKLVTASLAATQSAISSLDTEISAFLTVTGSLQPVGSARADQLRESLAKHTTEARKERSVYMTKAQRLGILSDGWGRGQQALQILRDWLEKDKKRIIQQRSKTNVRVQRIHV